MAKSSLSRRELYFRAITIAFVMVLRFAVQSECVQLFGFAAHNYHTFYNFNLLGVVDSVSGQWSLIKNLTALGFSSSRIVVDEANKVFYTTTYRHLGHNDDFQYRLLKCDWKGNLLDSLDGPMNLFLDALAQDSATKLFYSFSYMKYYNNGIYDSAVQIDLANRNITIPFKIQAGPHFTDFQVGAFYEKTHAYYLAVGADESSARSASTPKPSIAVIDTRHWTQRRVAMSPFITVHAMTVDQSTGDVLALFSGVSEIPTIVRLVVASGQVETLYTFPSAYSGYWSTANYYDPASGHYFLCIDSGSLVMVIVTFDVKSKTVLHTTTVKPNSSLQFLAFVGINMKN